MNYTELTAALQDYLETDEATFVSYVPRFVRQAEERILRSVQIPELRKNATSTTTASNQYLTRPTDLLAVFSLSVVDGIGQYTYLYPKDVSFIRDAYPGPSSTGLPLYYAQFDGKDTVDAGHFILGPTPDDTYTVELHYYFDPPSIVSSGTSWLGDNAESALLYGTLSEAYTFLKGDPDLVTLYAERYQGALAELQSLASRTRKDSYRNGEPPTA